MYVTIVLLNFRLAKVEAVAADNVIKFESGEIP